MPLIHVILMDYSGFPLYRERACKGTVIPCGLGHLLDNMQKNPAGIEYRLQLIINLEDESNTLDAASISMKKDFYLELRQKYPFIEKLTFRDNVGQDFGAYNHAFGELLKDSAAEDILFMNSTINGPLQGNWLLKFYRIFHKKDDVGLCGISLHSHNTNEKNHPFSPHVGSYCFYTTMKILEKTFGSQLYGSSSEDKNLIVKEGEIRLSADVMKRGLKICSIEDEHFYYTLGDNHSFPIGDTNLERAF